MLTEWLYKARGIDKWPTTTATVNSTKIFSSSKARNNTILFIYTPGEAPSQRGKLVADDSTTLFGINPSDTFDLQYDPKNPKRIYCTEAKAGTNDLGILIVVGVVVFIVYHVVASCVRNFGHHV
jgi:hypothetical protein